jgi:hypothetical protein
MLESGMLRVKVTCWLLVLVMLPELAVTAIKGMWFTGVTVLVPVLVLVLY